MTFQRLPFESVFADESGGNVKTPQAQYLPDGEFAVVDQGQALIGGYTNQRERLCGQGRSAIVFGDHTRCIKYIDFPFCMGADGVKVLRPKIEADLKYLYYFLISLDIPSAGYDRHYKYLKRTEVVLPPLPEQRRIAAILDQADALRAKRREALARLDSLTQSIFIEMFGDPASNPMGWPDSGLGDAVQLMQYGPRFYDEAYSVDGVRIARITDLSEEGDLDFESMPRMAVTPKDLTQFALQPGDLIFARTGATVGKVALYREGNPPCIPGAYFIRMKFKSEVAPDYAATLLNCPSVREMVTLQSRQAAQQNFSGPGLRRLPLPIPPLALQQTFATRIQAVKSLTATHRAALAELDALFASLQHRAFAGQLS